MIKEIRNIILRDVRTGARSGGSWAQGMLFFILFMVLTAFALGPEQSSRSVGAVALVWLAACLASQLSLERLFADDIANGMLEYWRADNHGLSTYVLGKFIAQWILAFAPILLLSPLGAIMLGAPIQMIPVLFVSLLIGGPALISFGAMASALTANVRGTGLLIVLISGPLLASPLIFGVGSAQAGQILSSDLKILGAISLLSIVLCPFISALALKVHLE